jgi:hypothetical protein
LHGGEHRQVDENDHGGDAVHAGHFGALDKIEKVVLRVTETRPREADEKE